MSEPRDEPPPVPGQPREALLPLLLRSPLALTVLCPLTFVVSLFLLESPGHVGDAFWHSSRTWLLHALAALLPVLYVVSFLGALEGPHPGRPGTPTQRRAVVFCTVLVVVLGMLPPLIVLLKPPLVQGLPVDVDALAQLPGIRVKLPVLGLLGAVATVPHLAHCFGTHVQLIGSLAEPPGELDADVLRYQQLRSRMTRSLGFIAAHVGTNVLVLGVVRNLLLDILPSRQDLFPASFVLGCGVYLTGLLASIYLPARRTMNAVGEVLANRLVQSALGPRSTRKAWTEEYQAVRPYLGLRGSVLKELQDAVTVLSPLVASVSSLFLGMGG